MKRPGMVIVFACSRSHAARSFIRCCGAPSTTRRPDDGRHRRTAQARRLWLANVVRRRRSYTEPHGVLEGPDDRQHQKFQAGGA